MMHRIRARPFRRHLRDGRRKLDLVAETGTVRMSVRPMISPRADDAVAEARVSNLIVFDDDGRVVEGDGLLELSAHSIHAPLHRITGARVVLHTHQTWAMALNMLENNRLLPLSQTAAFFQGNVAYDDTYAG